MKVLPSPRLALPSAARACLLACAIALAACSPAGSPGASAIGAGDAQTEVKVVLNNAGCAADRASVPAGTVVFNVVNEGGEAVSELELMQGERILAERENLVPGLSGSFTVALEPGSYRLYCPGATTPESAFEVTDSGS